MPQRPLARPKRTPPPSPGAGAAAWASIGMHARMAAPAAAPAPECQMDAASERGRGAGVLEHCGAACAPAVSSTPGGEAPAGTGRAPGQQPQAYAPAQWQQDAAEGRLAPGTLEQRAQARSQGPCLGFLTPPAQCCCTPHSDAQHLACTVCRRCEQELVPMPCGQPRVRVQDLRRACFLSAQARLLDHRRLLAAAQSAAEQREQLRAQVRPGCVGVS